MPTTSYFFLYLLLTATIFVGIYVDFRVESFVKFDSVVIKYFDGKYKSCKTLAVPSEVDLTSETKDSVLTKVLGHPHSDESKAKISAANKGKTPWNYGRQHSEETRKRIAEKTRESILKRKLEKANELGITIEEMENAKKEVKLQKRNATLKGGLTEDGRKRISESVRRRWEDPLYKEMYSKKMRGNRNHSEATRKKISTAIKLKWLDVDYRSIERKPPNEEVRARISAALKAKWEQPQYRERMKNSSYTRTDEWRAVISQKVREKWRDPVYKEAVTSALRKHFDQLRELNNSTSKRRSSSISKELLQQRRELAKMQRAAEREKKSTIKAAKQAVRNRKDNSLDLKSLLGKELWFEEKMKRKPEGGKFMDDDDLMKQLFEEWSDEEEAAEEEEEEEEDDDFDIDGLKQTKKSSRKKRSRSSKDSEEGEEIDSEEDDLGLFFDEDDLLVSSNAEEDLIEVYDEDGELVGVYDVQEFEKIKSSGVP